MAYQIDQQFIQKYTFLVREVLTDEASYVSRNDQHFQKLNNYLFSKSVETPFANIPDADKEDFKKYFYYGATAGQPRQDVPFADSPQDQANFFDQFHQQAKILTYNFSRLDLLRPSFADDKATAATFSNYQEDLLLKGMVYPLMHNLEQQQISELERQKTGRTPTEEEKNAANANPYQNLGNKILVKGTSGQFDTVLSYAQLEEIAGEEDILRKQGLEGEPMLKLLKEYIAKRYPDLQIYISPDGKIVPFLRGAGISATGMPVVAEAGGTGEYGAITFAGLISEMKIRQGRKMQYQTILASKGTLAPSPISYQVIDSAGIATKMNGLTIGLDQEGQGNHAIFFVADNQGVGAKVIVDTGEDRISGLPDFNFTIYPTPDTDLPSNPKISLPKPELPRLKTPLLPLYRELSETGEYRTVPGRPIREPGMEGGLPPEMPGQEVPAEPEGGTKPAPGLAGPAFSGQKPDVEALARLRAARGKREEAEQPQPPSAVPRTATGSRQPRPKIPTGKAPQYKPPVAQPAPAPAAAAPTGAPRPAVKPKVDGGGGVAAQRSTPPKKSHAGAIVAGSTISLIAATLGSALANLLIS